MGFNLIKSLQVKVRGQGGQYKEYWVGHRLLQATVIPSASTRFLGTFGKLTTSTVSFIMFVRLSAWNNSAPTGGIFLKFDI
jgi:hypothetical protein